MNESGSPSDVPPTDFDGVQVQDAQDVVFGWTPPVPEDDVPEDDDGA